MWLPNLSSFERGPRRYWVKVLRYHFQRYEHPLLMAMRELKENADARTRVYSMRASCYMCQKDCYWGVYRGCHRLVEVWTNNYDGDREIQIGYCSPDKHAGPFCLDCAPEAYKIEKVLFND